MLWIRTRFSVSEWSNKSVLFYNFEPHFWEALVLYSDNDSQFNYPNNPLLNLRMFLLCILYSCFILAMKRALKEIKMIDKNDMYACIWNLLCKWHIWSLLYKWIVDLTGLDKKAYNMRQYMLTRFHKVCPIFEDILKMVPNYAKHVPIKS